MEKGGKSRNPLPYQIQKEESGQGWPPDLYAVHSCGRGSFHAGFGILKNHATDPGMPPGVPPPSKTCPEQVCHAPPHPASKSHQKGLKVRQQPESGTLRHGAPGSYRLGGVSQGMHEFHHFLDRLHALPFPAFPNKCGARPQLWTPHHVHAVPFLKNAPHHWRFSAAGIKFIRPEHMVRSPRSSQGFTPCPVMERHTVHQGAVQIKNISFIFFFRQIPRVSS